MGSIAECKGQRKQSVNWKNKQQKLPNLNNTEKTNEQSFRDLWNSNKKPTFMSMWSWKEGERGRR